MSHEYTIFKWVITQIDKGCSSFDDYDDFLPRVSAEGFCHHFESEALFLEKALNLLDTLCACKIDPATISDDEAKAASDLTRLIEQAQRVNREEFTVLLKEDWEARCVACAD